MKQKIKNKNDWFMTGLIDRYECPKQPKGHQPKDGATWLNHFLIQASSPQTAYDKAKALGQANAKATNESQLWSGKWRFVGIAELAPICGDITDGTELL